MKNITTDDFNKLECLLKNKSFDELTGHEKQWILTFIDETEYITMSELYAGLDKVSDNISEIEPLAATKNKLDMAFKSIAKPNVFLKTYHLKIPVYQSVAVALVFFMIGIFATNYMTKPIVVHDTVEVIKYIVKPSIANNLKPIDKQDVLSQKKSRKTIKNKVNIPEKTKDRLVITETTNPEIAMQQEIAMQNVNRVVNEKNGNSIEGDTVLQKMLVTIY